ncbi:PREDICTED: probable leucine-rich repeat receptor-like protein kinase At5g49770 [Theobroma cacao]|uniref:non-specific serine/threonine protein kinase n=1 Tax=Theobroma cacao TaxID=3641 RepID=A0AB32WHN4_THECC|nr:PREDICTED: probable leucine-rich repeat receptor-like protein kinase At5g49770 [Theobroma cacao]
MFRDLSYNQGLTGSLPASIGNLKNLTNLILVGCGFNGPIPDSIGSLSQLRFLSLNSNGFTGRIPPSIGKLSNLVWLDLADNQLEGPIPVSNVSTPGLDMLIHTQHFHFGKNKLSGQIPFQLFSSDMTLIHLLFESNELTGSLPSTLGLVQTLEVVRFDNNSLNGHLPLNLNNLSRVQYLFLSNNKLTAPLPDLTGMNSLNTFYCKLPPSNSGPLYSTPPSKNCLPVSCSSDQISSPTCKCAHPYTGTLLFGGISFSDFRTSTPYEILEWQLLQFFQSHQLPVDSVSLSDPRMDLFEYHLLDLAVFPYGQSSFNRTGIFMIAFVLSNPTFRAPRELFGPYTFIGDNYEHFSDEPANSKKSSIATKIGAAAGASVLFLLLVLAGTYAYRQKKRAERATKESNPFAHWDSKKSSGSIPQLKGARCFSFEELTKYTNNFSEANDIGSGSYGKVYRGTLPTGELIAIKRAQQGSVQGGLEFKTEIELLSRVHHKNVVSLLGFCFERGEQMLIYEYVPNGSLSDSLSGKSGIRMDWTRRLKIALGAARGLAYLHELANPPIIHRDIKSSNILLDERLNAKVADFGLSKPMGDSERGHVTTQVKGTMGYLDPEYYMTQQLTEKSDVYSFGVLMLEIVTARKPIERGKYIVKEVRLAMDKTKSLYNLQEILDASIGFVATPKGLEMVVDLAMSCVEESGADRPTMGEVVKEIENIMQLAGMNPNVESASSSATYEEATKGGSLHPYSDDSSAYSGAFPAPR